MIIILFFFQAEDGIRDGHVTGVQTCALPITVKSDTTLVIIPTFNEIENLPLITKRVREATPEVHILIVDDSSPDGTGELADEYAGKDDHVHVIHRESKDGLLGAYIAGFKWGLERDYQVLCEMDADGSHAPEQLHLLLEQIADEIGRAHV